MRSRTRSRHHRTMLGFASVLLLTGTAAAVALQEPSDPEPITQATSSARPVGVDAYCPGPLEIPEELLATNAADELSAVPPASTVQVSTIAVEPGSGLLFGSTTPSETLMDSRTGMMRTPVVTTAMPIGSTPYDASESADLGAAVRVLPETPEPLSMQAHTADGGAPVTDTVQVSTTTEGDYRGITVTPCRAAVTSASFLGFSTDSGDSAVLTLRNVSAQAATAAVQVWTEDGPADMQGRSRVVVAPGEVEQVLIETIAAGHTAVAVGIEVLGAPLVTTLQTTARDGLAPVGSEIMTSQPAAAREQVLPGVHVTTDQPSLVVLNPGGEETTAQAIVEGPEGRVDQPALSSFTIPAGGITEIPMQGVPAGNYTVRVTADDPVSSVVRVRSTGAAKPGETIAKAVDSTMVTPTGGAVDTGSVLAIAPGTTDGRLVFSAEHDDADVTLIPVLSNGAAGTPVEVQVPAGTTVTTSAADLGIPQQGVAGIVLAPNAGVVHGAWVQLGAGSDGGRLISVRPLREPRVVQDTIDVHLQN